MTLELAIGRHLSAKAGLNNNYVNLEHARERGPHDGRKSGVQHRRCHLFFLKPHNDMGVFGINDAGPRRTANVVPANDTIKYLVATQ
ncbi:hypothetical protein [Bradyrhizobium sp. NC92]|uniref:hypothetical protein n=1 Tax=Bradyrhizobium sp. (strain NC92) TaxID=55395 RepID=UPI0021A99AB1|nr:hypothetical protein [Bradyrhizobium sp. NC92]UWU68127.1 hypothetical protein N2602_34260 [Bradyrhizobium sp. NC92]